jgi:hypothetical protein
MIIYHDAGEQRWRAIYFDQEGHVIHYTVSVARPSAVTFESEAPPTQPRYQLAYRMDGQGQLVITFSIAKPGQPFEAYTEGTARKVP